jgi:hypothetical protein
MGGYIGHIAVAAVAVAKHSSEPTNLDPQVALGNGAARPDICDQFTFGYQVTRVIDQCDQDVERPAADIHRDAIFFKKASTRREPKGAE